VMDHVVNGKRCCSGAQRLSCDKATPERPIEDVCASTATSLAHFSVSRLVQDHQKER